MNISMASVTIESRKLPPRIGFNAVAGYGKTSTWAFARNPIYMMAKGETGLETLVSEKQIPPTPHFHELMNWGEVIETTKALLKEDHEYKTLILDAAGSFEALMHQSVCDEHYKGEWGEKGFTSYMRGYEVSLPVWQDWLDRLDALRVQRGMTIVLLSHVQIKPFANPEGENYDRYIPVLHAKTWAITERWLDIVLFGNWYTIVESKGGKGKGKGGQTRFIYTQRHAAYDAKNRHGLPEEIAIPNDGPESGYKALKEAFIHG